VESHRTIWNRRPHIEDAISIEFDRERNEKEDFDKIIQRSIPSEDLYS
jgi:hypothetical protein